METPVGGIHVWAEHDTWWDIAQRYTGNGMNWVLIAEANLHVGNPNRVQVGARIQVPRELLT